jgi:hypothetical protein
MADAQENSHVSPEDQEKWQELEYSGCFYCDKPWDHHVNAADGTIYLCIDCYERRYAGADTIDPVDHETRTNK